MKALFVMTALVLGSMAGTAHADQSTTNVHQAYQEVSTSELKSWYDQGKQMTVVDARTKENYNGVLLPSAIWVPYKTTDQELQAKLPSKEAVIVVYCCNAECPASARMTDRLLAAGYKQVYRYPGGLDEWMRAGYTTVNQ